MKVKVSEAKGQVLDYLVAQAMGMKIYRSKSGRWMRANYGEFNHRHGTPWFEPTRSWGYAGPIIEREWLGCYPVAYGLKTFSFAIRGVSSLRLLCLHQWRSLWFGRCCF
jgi:hypothetical protein